MKSFYKHIKNYDEAFFSMKDVGKKPTLKNIENKKIDINQKKNSNIPGVKKENKSFFSNNNNKNNSIISNIVKKTQEIISGEEGENSNTPKVAKNLIKNTYGRFNKNIAKNIKKITSQKTQSNKIFNTAEKNFKLFYNNFVEIIRKNIERKNFDFANDEEGKICANIVESFGDLNLFIKKQYPNINMFFNKDYSEIIKLIFNIENDISNKIKTIPTNIKKYSILKGIK